MENSIKCSQCGQILPKENFIGKYGVTKRCTKCRLVEDQTTYTSIAKDKPSRAKLLMLLAAKK